MSKARIGVNINMPQILQEYLNASNAHDVNAILSCFSDDAIVRDEGKDFHSKKMIEDWAAKTLEKYKFQFKPLSVKSDDAKVVVSIEVSGTFPGSPVNLDYYFTIQDDKILSLAIE
ncbi:MAG TPA: nuclear transport factor 2 family protein [Chthoniobacterales bacterium]|nr:nuclear transport factor 2 family protein [Chthoniobacterales bacterium]